MNHSDFFPSLLSITGASEVVSVTPIQSLWSGYGEISRVVLRNHLPVVVKHIRLPDEVAHPRGWATDLSHQRKINSYTVERCFYQQYGSWCDSSCRVPLLIGSENSEKDTLLVLEDLNACGFPVRAESLSKRQIRACVSWLARFHARFLGVDPEGLWQKGTYWHLDTRPDELEALTDVALKKAASALDRALIDGVPQTLVHGDAKVANFCFSQDGESVAAVDFQYVGGGCGMKDLAYFMGSCLDEFECESQEAWILNDYFYALRLALAELNCTVDVDALEASWRSVFPIAWADFHRFLKGWSPGHWKLNSYSERMCRKALTIIA
ncbi:MAG: ecdysteroid 22-kinase family protein [Agarilytica sp.]